jgi:hypothetical protein
MGKLGVMMDFVEVTAIKQVPTVNAHCHVVHAVNWICQPALASACVAQPETLAAMSARIMTSCVVQTQAGR